MSEFRIGVLGSGDIVRRVGRALQPVEEIELYCVASRRRENAERVAREFGFRVVYDTYEQVLDDPKVDLVYIGLLHPLHYPYAAKSLEAGKPVLCEKPFTMNAREARKLIESFGRKGLFLGEALWTRFLPAVTYIREVLERNSIGRVVLADVNMICNIAHLDRMVNPEKGGGALLDLGVYALNFVDMFLGLNYSDMRTLCSRHATSVDDTEAVILQYPDGKLATCKISMSGCGNPRGVLYGTKGRIEVDDVMNFKNVFVYDNRDVLLDRFSLDSKKTGYEYEFLACRQAILAGRREFEEMPLGATLGLMEQYDRLRKAWGYPVESN